MKRLLLVAAITTLLAGCATTTSPTGRRQVVGAVSDEQLAQLGAQAFAEAKAKTRQSTDSRQNTYVRCVVQQVVRQLPAEWQNVGWETALFVDTSPNAFALPGGKVGVNTGIFSVAKNQDQLAAVVAHEVGHVYSRHHNERITRQMGTQGALQVLGALAGSRYGERRDPGRKHRRASRFSVAQFAHAGKRSRRRRSAVDGARRLRSASGGEPVGEHDRREQQPPTRMVVDPPQSAEPHPGTQQPRREPRPCVSAGPSQWPYAKVWLNMTSAAHKTPYRRAGRF